MSLNIWKAGDAIYLGPVVGIFVNPIYISFLSKGNIPLTARKDIQANMVAKCLIYFFSLDHIDWQDKTIQGYTVDPESNQWTFQTFPFPDVIYDCGVNFPASKKSKVKRIRQRFREDPGIQFINDRDYLGKWELYTKLSKYEELRPYLPETIRYQSVDDLQTMLAKHRLIYIKSFYGSRGREVMSVRRRKNMFIVKFFHSGLRNRIVKRVEQMEELIKRFLGNKPLIIQEGIDVITYKKRRVDLRVLICKKRFRQMASDIQPGQCGKAWRNHYDDWKKF